MSPPHASCIVLVPHPATSVAEAQTVAFAREFGRIGKVVVPS